MRNVAGISQTEAKKSSDMFAKCRYMDELTGGRGIIFATGTPISNSMTELYTMMRYLQYDSLKEHGLEHFDSWASTFGEKVTAIELAPEGTGFRSKTRFAKFFNLPELISFWKEAADIQTADMLCLPVPDTKYINVVTKPSGYQKELVQSFAERADAVRKGLVEPYQDNMLKITNDGRKLALDQRLLNPLLPDDPDSKVNTCIRNISQIWNDTADIKGTQLVFCDLSTPGKNKTIEMQEVNGVYEMIPDQFSNVYDDMRRKLTAKGIPKEEIAFIHEAATDTQKAQLFSKVRKGQIRILFGSTAKMGAGTNVQTRLAALHHLDCPWRPSDIEQREGRILRQGNKNKFVRILKYVTEGTFDAYNWSLLEIKQKFIGQIITSKLPARSCEDVDATALSYAEVKALSTGDPRIKEKMDLDIQVSKLKLLKANYENQRYEMEDKIVYYFPQKMKASQEKLSGLKEDNLTLAAHPVTGELFSMEVMGTVYSERKEAGNAIIETAIHNNPKDNALKIGTYRGFAMELTYHYGIFYLTLKGKESYTAELGTDASGNISRINHALETIPEQIKNTQQTISVLETQFENTKEEMKIPFLQEKELSEKSSRLNQLNLELNQDNKQSEEKTKPERKLLRGTPIIPTQGLHR